MNRSTRVGLLSIIALTQVFTLVGGFVAYEQMSESMRRLQLAYQQLYEETYPDGPLVDYGLTPNPFVRVIPAVLLGLILTLVLLTEQLRHKT